MFCILKPQLSATSSISSRFDTIRKYFTVSTPLLSRCMRGIPLAPVNSSLSAAAERGISQPFMRLSIKYLYSASLSISLPVNLQCMQTSPFFSENLSFATLPLLSHILNFIIHYSVYKVKMRRSVHLRKRKKRPPLRTVSVLLL